MSALYTTSATATGGREGRAATADGRLEVRLDIPRELGGGGGDGTNPEQLFACGYAACFESALRLCARKAKVRIKELSITATVEIHEDAAGDGFALAVSLAGETPELSTPELAGLMEQAHAICPYSNAVRGNVAVELTPSVAAGEEATARRTA